MALVQAYLGIDSLSVDLNFYSRYFYDDEFYNNINFQYGGRTYEDAYLINGYDGSVDLIFAFLGYDIGFDSSGRVNRGTVTALAEGTYSGYDIWDIQGISIPASRLNSVASTYSNADDRALIGSVLNGNDTIQLSAYDDRFEGWGGNDRMFGGGGNDTLLGGEGNDTIQGGVGNDMLNGGAGIDRMDGGAGNDTYQVDNAGDLAIELIGEGIDLVQSSVNHTLRANVENLTLLGTGHLTGAGNAVANLITGNAGNNHLSGLAGNDTINGAVGNDVIDGGTGIDRMAGGVGNDAYRVDNGRDLVIETANQGTDHVQSTVSYNLSNNVEHLSLLGTGNFDGNGNTLANLLNGNSGSNRLSGLNGNDTINGGAGNDVINGGGGNDFLNGGIGNDRIIGSIGADRMAGGSGADSFVFTALSDSTVNTSGRDTISDFNHAQHDRIDLVAIDANARDAGNQAFRYLGDSAFTGQAGELSARNVSGGTLISGDVNGDRIADFALLLDDRMSLGANSFIL